MLSYEPLSKNRFRNKPKQILSSLLSVASDLKQYNQTIISENAWRKGM